MSSRKRSAIHAGFMVSDQAGQVEPDAGRTEPHSASRVDKKDPRLDGLMAEIKLREAEGYAYEAADASLELLALRRLGSVPDYFSVDSFRVNVERRHNAIGEPGHRVRSRRQGHGQWQDADVGGRGQRPGQRPRPIALRKDLGDLSALINDLELVDYKVRILNGGTEAITRVLIESRDGGGNRWFTVGVSSNIIDASFEALLDAINYKLLKATAAAEAAE